MKEFIKDILIAIAIVVVITLIIKPTIVKESSMEPTLYENNYLIINKLAYFHKDHPSYGDIIVFRSNMDRTDGTGKKLLIKRVIGVEGDVMRIEDGQVYRNGELLDEPYIHGQQTWAETGGDSMEVEIGDDELFCMGDNREVSLDSRSPEVGNVDEETVVGKAVVRLYPFNEITRF
ncbi:MAG: signal peptidase I [Firmicutes bacterium]|nr:signal peptidase I [Bacillota bacterium]